MKSLLGLCLFGIVSCSITGNLYPVSSSTGQVVAAAIPMTVNGVMGNSGTVSLVLPTGEKCKGNWSVVAPRMAGVVSHTGGGTVSSGLNTAFISMHGQSFIDVGSPGINKGQAILVGDRGTTIECAFLVGSGTASGYGTAKDNGGTTYKVIF